MKNKIILLILLCFYQISSTCYKNYERFFEDIDLPYEIESYRIYQCTSLQLTDEDKQNYTLLNNHTLDSCCAIVLFTGSIYYEGPGVLTERYHYFCAPAQESEKKLYLQHYGSDDKYDCIYCNGTSYCVTHYIKYYKFIFFLLLFLLIDKNYF